MGKHKLYALIVLFFCCFFISGCGYKTPSQRQKVKMEAKGFLENKYPDHEFEVEVQVFAESMTDFLLLLHNETGYYDIYIDDDSGHHFHYNETGDNTRDAVMDSIINSIKRDQKYSKKNE